MKISDFIGMLARLPQDAEIALLAHSGFARPPSVERINLLAWQPHAVGPYGGLRHIEHAYLIRPTRDII